MSFQKKNAQQIISPSLLCPWKWDFEYKYNPNFDLGMGDWISEGADDEELLDMLGGKENEPTLEGKSSECVSGPSTKRQRLSLKLSKKAPLAESGNRFTAPVDEQTREKASEGLKPANTEASTRWAVKHFAVWAENRRRLVPDDPVPEGLLQCHDHAKVCKYLCLFVPATLRSLLSGLNRMLQSNKAPFSILDKHDTRFRDLFNTLDLVSSTLHREGVGAEKKSAPIIEVEHENLFWEKNLLGYSTPRTLQRAVFFYVGLHFALRGVQEQYDLVPHQFARFPPDASVYDSSVYYQYTEFILKNNQHRFKDVNLQNKVCRGMHKSILDTYLEKLPPNASYFYMHRLDRVPDKDKPWYSKQRVGINSMKEILSKLSSESGCGVRYTNHSLRATATTGMFSKGVPEKVIAEKTGHRSL